MYYGEKELNVNSLMGINFYVFGYRSRFELLAESLQEVQRLS